MGREKWLFVDEKHLQKLSSCDKTVVLNLIRVGGNYSFWCAAGVNIKTAKYQRAFLTIMVKSSSAVSRDFYGITFLTKFQHKHMFMSISITLNTHQYSTKPLNHSTRTQAEHKAIKSAAPLPYYSFLDFSDVSTLGIKLVMQNGYNSQINHKT